MKLFSEDTLSHYGIQGQKWGERHYQYPDGRFTPEGKERYFGSKKIKEIGDINNNKLKYNKHIHTNSDLIRKKSSNAFMFLNFEANKISKEIEERRKNEKYDEKAQLYLQNKKSTIDEDMINTNPYYNTDSYYNPLYEGASNNCPFVSATYVLRRAGYDAVANLGNGMYLGDSDVAGYDNLKDYANNLFGSKCIKNSNSLKLKQVTLPRIAIKKKEGMEMLEKGIKKMKNNEVMMITFTNVIYEYGHVMNIEKNNGKIYMVDAQSGKKSLFSDFKDSYFDEQIDNRDYGTCIRSYVTIDPSKVDVNTSNASKVSHSDFIQNNTLSHYGIQGQKWGERHYQYPDGRFTPEGKERYFGKISTIIRSSINKGKNIINSMFNNDKKINIKIGKSIDKDFQQLMLNKNKYTPEEFNKKLFELSTQKNIYNQNLKPRQTWGDSFVKTFSDTTSKMAGAKLGKAVIDFIFGEN